MPFLTVVRWEEGKVEFGGLESFLDSKNSAGRVRFRFEFSVDGADAFCCDWSKLLVVIIKRLRKFVVVVLETEKRVE